jgi:hypothetical protein
MLVTVVYKRLTMYVNFLVNYGDMLLLDVPSLMAGSTTLVFPGYGVYQVTAAKE